MNHQNQNKKSPKRPLNSYARYSGLVIQMLVIIAVGTYAGVKLDEYYPNKHKLFSIILSLLSVILSIVFVIRRIIAASKDNE